MPTDIEIARSVTPLPITEVAKNAGVDVKHLIPYGFDKAKVDWVHLPYDFLAKMSNDIINRVKGINRVVYDISSKPPATIEWE